MTDEAPSPSPTVSQAPSPPSAGRKRRRWVVVGVVLALGVGVGAVWLRSGERAAPPTVPKLPDPNGYDDLVRAGSLISGEWPNKGDFEKADPATIRPFLVANKGAIDRARVGMARECMVPLETSPEGLGRIVEGVGRLRSVGRLFVGESVVAESEGRFGDASKAALDLLELGQDMTQGGLGINAVTGWAVQVQAINRLRKLRDRLSLEESRAVLKRVEAIDGRRISLDEIDRRWASWYQGTFNAGQRLMLRANGVEAKGRADEVAMAKTALDKVERATRFFLVELAIHAHRLEKGTWPRTVEELVPAYLAKAPIDPTSGEVVAYPANLDGELTTDLDAIARPDGAVTPRP